MGLQTASLASAAPLEGSVYAGTQHPFPVNIVLWASSERSRRVFTSQISASLPEFSTGLGWMLFLLNVSNTPFLNLQPITEFIFQAFGNKDLGQRLSMLEVDFNQLMKVSNITIEKDARFNLWSRLKGLLESNFLFALKPAIKLLFVSDTKQALEICRFLFPQPPIFDTVSNRSYFESLLDLDLPRGCSFGELILCIHKLGLDQIVRSLVSGVISTINKQTILDQNVRGFVHFSSLSEAIETHIPMACCKIDPLISSILKAEILPLVSHSSRQVMSIAAELLAKKINLTSNERDEFLRNYGAPIRNQDSSMFLLFLAIAEMIYFSTI